MTGGVDGRAFSARRRFRRIVTMSEYIQVLTTVSQPQDAERIAQVLLERRLAACVQVFGPTTSTYRWQGKIEVAQEWQCWAKTRRDLFPELESAIRGLHPYEVPEIVALPIVEGYAPYLAWVDCEVKRREAPTPPN
jgi:periplasmic divalent cation tolerance protein